MCAGGGTQRNSRCDLEGGVTSAVMYIPPVRSDLPSHGLQNTDAFQLVIRRPCFRVTSILRAGLISAEWRVLIFLIRAPLRPKHQHCWAIDSAACWQPRVYLGCLPTPSTPKSGTGGQADVRGAIHTRSLDISFHSRLPCVVPALSK